jgi:hypothetical protein
MRDPSLKRRAAVNSASKVTAASSINQDELRNMLLKAKTAKARAPLLNVAIKSRFENLVRQFSPQPRGGGSRGPRQVRAVSKAELERMGLSKSIIKTLYNGRTTAAPWAALNINPKSYTSSEAKRTEIETLKKLASPLFNKVQLSSTAGAILELGAIQIAAIEKGYPVADMHRNTSASTLAMVTSPAPNYMRTPMWFLKTKFSLKDMKMLALGLREPAPSTGVPALMKVAEILGQKNAWRNHVRINNAAANAMDNSKNNNNNTASFKGKGVYFVEPDAVEKREKVVDVMWFGQPRKADLITGVECKITLGKKEGYPGEALQGVKWVTTVLLAWYDAQMATKGPDQSTWDPPPVVKLYFLSWFFGIPSTSNNIKNIYKKQTFKPLDAATVAQLRNEVGLQLFGMQDSAYNGMFNMEPINPEKFQEITGLNFKTIEFTLREKRMQQLANIAAASKTSKRRGLFWSGASAANLGGYGAARRAAGGAGKIAPTPITNNYSKARYEGRWGNALALAINSGKTLNAQQKMDLFKLVRDVFPRSIATLMRDFGLAARWNASAGQRAGTPAPAPVFISNAPKSRNSARFIQDFSVLYFCKARPANLNRANLPMLRMWVDMIDFSFTDASRIPPEALNMLRQTATTNPQLATFLTQTGLAGQVAAPVNAAAVNAEKLVSIAESNTSVDFEKLYRSFLNAHVGRGEVVNAVLAQRATNWPNSRNFYTGLTGRKRAVNNPPT